MRCFLRLSESILAIILPAIRVLLYFHLTRENLTNPQDIGLFSHSAFPSSQHILYQPHRIPDAHIHIVIVPPVPAAQKIEAGKCIEIFVDARQVFADVQVVDHIGVFREFAVQGRRIPKLLGQYVRLPVQPLHIEFLADDLKRRATAARLIPRTGRQRALVAHPVGTVIVGRDIQPRDIHLRALKQHRRQGSRIGQGLFFHKVLDMYPKAAAVTKIVHDSLPHIETVCDMPNKTNIGRR